MTSTEFRRLTIAARDSLPNVTREIRAKILETYKAASDAVAAEVARAEIRAAATGNTIAVQSLESIQRQLAVAADDVAAAIEAQGRIGMTLSAERIGTINDTFMAEAFNRAGVAAVDRAVIAEIVRGVNRRVVESAVNRVWQDGYTFSQRCWRIGRKYQDDIKNLLNAGLAQGRDALEIARDIQAYTADGRIKLMQRWDRLKRGTREFSRRIPLKIDYRALRLVRTEMYASIRDANVQQGLVNPASTGLWDWTRQSSVEWGCECPDFERDSPYTLDALPGTPHANCLCTVTARMEPIGQFEGRLEAWSRGGSDPALDQWYQEVYLSAS